MKAKAIVTIVLLVALIPVVRGVVPTADKADKSVPGLKWLKARDTLRGLQGVHVVVEHLNADAERNGLTRETLQTDVELKLRRNGIKVLTEKERFMARGQPSLVVIVTVITMDGVAVSAAGISMELLQQVLLLRRGETALRACFAVTWISGHVVVAGPRDVAPAVRNAVKDLVDEFSNDYLAVNPRDAKTKQADPPK